MPAVFHCDNRATMENAKNSDLGEKSRHVRTRHNQIKKWLSQGIITLEFVGYE